MEFDAYTSNVQNCIHRILEIHAIDIEDSLRCCRELLAYGNREKDSRLLGFAHYYMGEAYYFSGDPQKQFISLFNALEHLEISENYDLKARTYNLLGILSNAQGNPATALDYYLQGLSLCQTHELFYVAGMIYSNIALLFTQIENYEKAIEYLQEAVRSYQRLEPTQALSNNLAVSYLALGQSYLRLKMLQNALECMKKVDSCYSNVEEEFIGITLRIFRAQLAHARRRFEERDSYIEEILALPLREYSLLTFYDDFLSLAHFLLEIRKDTALLQVLDIFESMAVSYQNLHIQIELTKIRLDYYQKANQDFLFLHSARQFYNLSIRQESENQKNIFNSLELRFALSELQKQQEQTKDENQRLLLKSESDALTGLPNRYKLNDYSELLLHKAIKKQLPLAVEILDIDYFKQYNDTYGHQAGDLCLISIAAAISSISSKNVFCARYGGDEFILLYYNMTKEEVEGLANELQCRITALKLEHKSSLSSDFVTVTQGLVYCTPKEGNRMWDFFHMADSALYEGKKNGRNNITLKLLA